MNNEETAILTGLIRQIAPAQKIDAFTADVWAPLLTDIRMVDAREAMINLGRAQSFIGPADIIREVKRIRSTRVAEGPRFDPDAYPEATDNAGYLTAIRDHTRRIADGEQARPSPERTPSRHNLEELLAPLVRRLNDDEGETGDRVDMGR